VAFLVGMATPHPASRDVARIQSFGVVPIRVVIFFFCSSDFG